MDLIPVRRALLSVTDKTGLVDFARRLQARGVELLSTGGTAAALREAGLRIVDVAAVTGLAEMLDGRVKTLHPKIHGGILADRDRPNHRDDMERHGIEAIDLVVVNLYAFEETVARAGVTDAQAVEKIDIGGPAMIRAAAKNHRHVVVVTNPARYPEVAAALEAHGGSVPRGLARELAGEAFRRTAAYDGAIGAWFGRPVGEVTAESMPDRLTLELEKIEDLRYGENPHQPAALYRPTGEPAGLAAVRRLHGKEMSYINYLDLDRALRLVMEFDGPAAVVIKHATPCGVGLGPDTLGAFQRAWAADPLSGFGGIVGLNRHCDEATAAVMSESFLELVAAPAFTPEALALLTRKKNLRLIECGGILSAPAALEFPLRPLLGAWLRQQADPRGLPDRFEVVTRRAPTAEEREALLTAWRICKHVKSNAIVLADATGSVGLGGGQTSRVDAVEDSIRKAVRGVGITPGTVMASDAFFPFRDSVDAAHAAGIRAVIQPGGSMRDEESVAACDDKDMTMVFTGRRAFLH